ncbi:MAG: type II toxin-antitoxin system RelE/ParE family toxin [Cryomorphaceae bacterium]|nr:type II toxin-antitoxin system RelE/ParE family toxin [Cryomorphaceae bacterium]
MRFYQVQPLKVQKKIDFVFDLVRNIEVVPIQYFKFLKDTNGIFEIKVVTHLSSLRFLCFFNNQKLIMVTNAFIKKSQKTPKKEIQIAERIKKEYESN